MFDHSSFEPDFENVLRVLNELEDYAEAAFIELDQQVFHGIPQTAQLQFEIVNGIVKVMYEKLPALGDRGMSEKLKQLVRLAFKEITGWHKQLDDDIKTAVKRVKQNSRGNEFQDL